MEIEYVWVPQSIHECVHVNTSYIHTFYIFHSIPYAVYSQQRFHKAYLSIPKNQLSFVYVCGRIKNYYRENTQNMHYNTHIYTNNI